MKKIILCISTLALLAIACQKLENNVPLNGDEMAPAVKMITETISGSRGVETKATIDVNAAFAWTETIDKVAVHVDGTTPQYVTSGAASASAATASFTVEYETGYERDAFAVYPSTIVDKDAPKYGQSGQPLDVKLPSSYTLDQVQGEVSPCPMIATNAPGAGWEFYQLCGLLRLTVNNIPPSTKRLEIDFNGNKVCGAFSVSIQSPLYKSVIATDDATEDNDVITITNSGETLFGTSWGDGKVFNIPLPTGEYSKITVTAYNEEKQGIATVSISRPFERKGEKEVTNKKGIKLSATFPAFSCNSSGSRVIFAPGNLQATTTDLGANWTWGFAKHQYDFIGSGGANTKITGNKQVSENGTVDLFSFSTDKSYYGITNSGDENALKGTFVDWGTIKTFNGITYPDNYWKTLSSYSDNNHEWWYIMRTRSTGTTVKGTEDARFTQATINTDGTSVSGIIIFPDNFVVPTESTSDIIWGDKINSYGSNPWPSWGGTSCTCKGWLTLESEGCVFLPAAGWRSGTSVSFSYNDYASRATSSQGKKYRVLHFRSANGTNTYWDQTMYIFTGSSVRLAHVE